jgi:cytoskeletal protein RodZ
MRTYAEFMAMTDDELIADFDSGAEHVVVGKQWTLDELVRRRQDRATDALQTLTSRLLWLTVAIAALTAVGAAASVIAALKA